MNSILVDVNVFHVLQSIYQDKNASSHYLLSVVNHR